jgi:hypothetical protein
MTLLKFYEQEKEGKTLFLFKDDKTCFISIIEFRTSEKSPFITSIVYPLPSNAHDINYL